MERAKPQKQIVKEWLLITLGIVFLTVGVYFFKFPNNFSTGGVSGLSVILAHYIPSMTPGTFVTVINVLLLLLGFAVFGRSFGMRTTYASLLFSGLTWLLERVLPMQAPMKDVIIKDINRGATLLPAVSAALLFNIGASSGGTDIVAMVLKKFTILNIGRALMCSDCIITVMACVAFGMETGLFSILGLLMKSLLVDMVLENINTHKCFHIITAHPEKIQDFIVKNLHRGATALQGEGVFTHEGRTVLLTVVNRHEAILLRKYIKAVDPTCFLLITNTGEIIGKGFRGVN